MIIFYFFSAKFSLLFGFGKITNTNNENNWRVFKLIKDAVTNYQEEGSTNQFEYFS